MARAAAREPPQAEPVRTVIAVTMPSVLTFRSRWPSGQACRQPGLQVCRRPIDLRGRLPMSSSCGQGLYRRTASREHDMIS